MIPHINSSTYISVVSMNVVSDREEEIQIWKIKTLMHIHINNGLNIYFYHLYEPSEVPIAFFCIQEQLENVGSFSDLFRSVRVLKITFGVSFLW